MKRWLFLWIANFACVGFVYEITCFLLPSWFGYHHLLAKWILWLVVANFVFEMTREKIFKSRVQPKNKAVFISGCDSGFGYHTAKQLDSMGFHVFAGCLFPTQGGAIELKKDCSERLYLVHVDVTKDESIQKAKDFIQKNIGNNSLWAIVNNAGINKGFNVDFSKMSDFKDVLEVNTLGQVRMTKAFLLLLKRSEGRIVNINSIAGRLTSPQMAAYAISKHASIGFTECLRQELEVWGIQVVSVEPEFFKTPLTSGKNVEALLETLFQSLDSETRADYGEEFLETIKTMTVNFSKSVPSRRIDIVIDAVVSAVSLQHPSPVYRPCGNLARKLFYYVAVRQHSFVIDGFLNLYSAYCGISKPKAAKKSL